MSTPKVMTLSFLLRDDAICLAMKKRGFGEGNWNGYGGKVEEGETVPAAAVREIKEESGVDVDERDLEEVALIDFYFEDGKHLHVHTYFTRMWDGEPIETEEMRPRWYTFDAIPYDLMWADDIHWLPCALKGEKLQGAVYFNSDGATIKNMKWNALSAGS
jgi:ADP-ribose pyrophosphatase YjhB (NUDIX family)